jgi:uncharacterized protein (TIGR02594 family)
VTAYLLATRFLGLTEAPGLASHPLVLAMLRLDQAWPEGDHTPWCGAFVSFVAWLLDLPRSRSLAARSWLTVGQPVALHEARVGFDVVVLSRGADTAAGHVGFYAGSAPDSVLVLGGNQGDAVSIQPFPSSRILGVRRLA